MDRRIQSPHYITIFRGHQEVYRITLRRTDPRFVKGEDLFRMAFEEISRLENNQSYSRRSTDPVRGKWTHFEVVWSGMTYRGDVRGQLIHHAA